MKFTASILLAGFCVSTNVNGIRLRGLHSTKSGQDPSQQTGGGMISCPDNGGYTGDENYIGKGPLAAPLRGAVGCVDNPLTVGSDGQTQVASLIYGPMENGFTTDQLEQILQCTSDTAIIGGLDTALADRNAEYLCGKTVEILDDCGGHAMPYHYHEKMTCLYTEDPVTGHSTRIGTAVDGNGIYGKYIDGGVVPTDLDACGGRFGVTPDSNGTQVYYYVVQDQAPFTLGCIGPVNSVEECRALYSTCGDDVVEVETDSGVVLYDPDCPCFDSSGSNVQQDNGNNDGDDDDNEDEDEDDDNQNNNNQNNQSNYQNKQSNQKDKNKSTSRGNNGPKKPQNGFGGPPPPGELEHPSKQPQQQPASSQVQKRRG